LNNDSNGVEKLDAIFALVANRLDKLARSFRIDSES
jgi:hypothetical protein